MDPSAPYDIVKETLNLLRKYQSQLEQYQRTAGNKDIVDFDIDTTCGELEKMV